MSWDDLRGQLRFRTEYDHLATMARDGDAFVQIGVGFGKGLAYLARQLICAGKAVRLVGVDPWTVPPDPEAAWGHEDAQWVREQRGPYNAFLAGMRSHAPEELEYVRTWRMASAEAARVFMPASCRGVVIDSGREYEAIRDDIMLWLRTVEPGGLLLGGNYSSRHPGARRAVRETFAQGNYTLHGDVWTVTAQGPDATPERMVDAASVHATIDRPLNVSAAAGPGGLAALTPGQLGRAGTIVASTSGIVLTTEGFGGGGVVLRVPDTSARPTRHGPPPRPGPRPAPQPRSVDCDVRAARRVRALGGLCNRLRVILSYRAALGSVEVVWSPDGEISHGRFSDVFEPLAGVSFTDFDESKPACLQTGDPHGGAPGHWQDAYREIILRPTHREKLRSLAPRPYSALHVRRTDLVPMAKRDNCYTTDEELIAWCHSAPGPIYLATDNGTTQRQFAGIIVQMGKNAIFQAPIPEHADQDRHDRRNTDLAAAAVDLFACAGSAHFKGTADSSFSNTIALLRGLGGWWS